MNILLYNGLPEEYDGIPISADFRNMVQVDLILHDPDFSETEKTIAALNQLYPEIPEDVQKAIDGLEWFFMRGEAKEGKGAGSSERKAFDFQQDGNIIYSSFYAAYGISLVEIEYLHWWEFMALFEGLPETTLMRKIMYWRTANTSDLPKGEKKHVLKMRNLFALKEPDREPLSVDEIDQKTKDRVAQRFEAAKRAKEMQT